MPDFVRRGKGVRKEMKSEKKGKTEESEEMENAAAELTDLRC